MTVTLDQIPELEGLQEGDSLTLVINAVNDDGTYEVAVEGGEDMSSQEPTLQEPTSQEPNTEGENAIKQALL